MPKMLDFERSPELPPQTPEELLSKFVDGYIDPAGGWTPQSIAADLRERWDSGELSYEQTSQVAQRLGLQEN